MASREIANELQFKWNLNDVDVRTKTVERTLAPLGQLSINQNLIN